MGRKSREFHSLIETRRWLNKTQAKRRLKEILCQTGSSLLELKIVLNRIKINS